MQSFMNLFAYIRTNTMYRLGYYFHPTVGMNVIISCMIIVDELEFEQLHIKQNLAHHFDFNPQGLI